MGGAAEIVVEAGDRLVATAPARPVPDGPAVGRCRGPQAGEQAADLWYRQGDESRRRALNCARLSRGRSPFCASASGSTPWARTTVRKAWARQARVTWRCQPGQLRTSYWASPTACLAASQQLSTVQRLPATRARSASVVPAGQKQT